MTPQPPAFDRVLAECLEVMIMEGRSITALVERYPQYKDELSELLTVAQTAHRVPKAKRIITQPDHQTLPAAKRASKGSATWAEFWAWLLFVFEQLRPNLAARASAVSWALVAALLVTLFSAGTVGVAYAANEAKPGDLLYGVDRALESIQLSLTFNSQRKAELSLSFAQERVAEAERLADESAPLRVIYRTMMDQEQQLEQVRQLVAQVQFSGEGTQTQNLERAFTQALSNREEAILQVAALVAAANTQDKPAAIAATNGTAKRPAEASLNDPQAQPAPGIGYTNALNHQTSSSQNFAERLALLESLQQQAQIDFEHGHIQAAKIALNKYENQVHLLAQTLVTIEDDDERAEVMAALIAEAQSRHSQVLAQLVEQLPAAAQAGLQRAIEASSQNNGQGNPGGGPPDNVPGNGPPDDKPGGGPPDTPPGRGN